LTCHDAEYDRCAVIWGSGGAPAVLAIGGGSYGVLYPVAGFFAVLGAFAILPVRRVR